MKILAIIRLSSLAIIRSLLFLLSSTCAVVSDISWGVRVLGVLFAIPFLGLTIFLIKRIGERYRER